jgi:hypothetical protein
VYFLIGRFALAQEQAVLHGVTIRDGEDVEDIEGSGTPVLTVVTDSGSRYAYFHLKSFTALSVIYHNSAGGNAADFNA